MQEVERESTKHKRKLQGKRKMKGPVIHQEKGRAKESFYYFVYINLYFKLIKSTNGYINNISEFGWVNN